jgi:hypothetical protein
MHKNITAGLFTLLTFYSINAAAMFCPTSFNSINLGDSVAQVLAQCGNPSSSVASTESPELPQEWSYFQKANPTDVGTMKISVAFDGKGKAINISVNSLGVGTTTICGGVAINVGDTMATIKNACGTPAYISKSEVGDLVITKINTLIYNGPPKVTLIFKNNALTERK